MHRHAGSLATGTASPTSSPCPCPHALLWRGILLADAPRETHPHTHASHRRPTQQQCEHSARAAMRLGHPPPAFFLTPRSDLVRFFRSLICLRDLVTACASPFCSSGGRGSRGRGFGLGCSASLQPQLPARPAVWRWLDRCAAFSACTSWQQCWATTPAGAAGIAGTSGAGAGGQSRVANVLATA